MYYSNEDFENFYVRYKAERLPRNICLREFCIWNKVPWNLKWEDVVLLLERRSVSSGYSRKTITGIFSQGLTAWRKEPSRPSGR